MFSHLWGFLYLKIVTKARVLGVCPDRVNMSKTLTRYYRVEKPVFWRNLLFVRSWVLFITCSPGSFSWVVVAPCVFSSHHLFLKKHILYQLKVTLRLARAFRPIWFFISPRHHSSCHQRCRNPIYIVNKVSEVLILQTVMLKWLSNKQCA